VGGETRGVGVEVRPFLGVYMRDASLGQNGSFNDTTNEFITNGEAERPGQQTINHSGGCFFRRRPIAPFVEGVACCRGDSPPQIPLSSARGVDSHNVIDRRKNTK